MEGSRKKNFFLGIDQEDTQKDQEGIGRFGKDQEGGQKTSFLSGNQPGRNREVIRKVQEVIRKDQEVMRKTGEVMGKTWEVIRKQPGRNRRISR